MRVRFAPSPTGYLHVGNLRTALLNYLWARQCGGEFMLRIDDTDTARCKSEYEEAIKANLRALGLVWDTQARQSERLAEYQAAADKLREAGRLYDCYETAEELELQRRVNLSQGRPPIYDRSALSLSDADKQALRDAGRKPYWRFRLGDEAISWEDHGRGAVSFDAGHLSDPVLFREDGRVLYTLSSVVDDAAFGISHIVRGEDHVVNTAVQIDIFRALGSAVPQFAHVPLLLDGEGKSLSKRLGSLSVGDLLQNIEGDALLSYLAHLGLSVAASGDEVLADLVRGFDMSSYGRAAARFDEGELRHLNMKYLRGLDYGQVCARLSDISIDESFWLLIRDNLEDWGDIILWRDIVFGDNFVGDISQGDREFLVTAAEVLPDLSPSDENFYALWVEGLKERSGRSGRDLFVPLRMSLTGRERGPELRFILKYLGRDEILRRLAA